MPVLCAAAGEYSEFTGFAGTTVRFASVAEAQRVLSADDDWMQATGDFQRQAVMGADSAVTMAAFKRWNAEAARPWAPEQRARWTRALTSLAPRFAALRVPLPKQVLLIHGNGEECCWARTATISSRAMAPIRSTALGRRIPVLATG